MERERSNIHFKQVACQPTQTFLENESEIKTFPVCQHYKNRAIRPIKLVYLTDNSMASKY